MAPILKDQKMKRKTSLLYLSFALLLSACGPEVIFQKAYDFEDEIWNADELAVFEVEIPDVSIPTDFFYNIRYRREYPYQNLYVQLQIEDSTGAVLLSQLQNISLFDAKTGEPKGKGLGSSKDREIRGLKEYTFPSPGTYTIKVEQRNRDEATPHVVSFGLWLSPSTND